MRVLICSNAYPPLVLGGAELMAHEQAKALVRLGHEVRAFAGELTASRPRHARIDDIHEGLGVHRIATVPEDYSPEYLNFLHPVVEAHFRDVLHEFRPDVVHCHNLTGLSVKLPILARQHGARTLCTLHDFWGFCLRNTAIRVDGSPCHDSTQCRACLPRIHDGRRLHVPMRFRKDFIRLALGHVDRFIAPSRYLASRYVAAGFPAERMTVLANGIDTARFRPAPPRPAADHVRVTFAGYFGAHKGVTTVIEALALTDALVPAGSPPVLLQLAGEGPEEGAYRARIAAMGLEDRVRFLGKVQPADMPGVYARSEIVVLPSVWDENQPVCLMEAMASGLPVVAARKGGIPELIEHGGNGLLFTAGDERDLAGQLAKLIADPGLRRGLGREGRRRTEGLSHDRQASRLAALYREPATGAGATQDPAHQIYAALGSLRRSTRGDDGALADGRHPRRYVMPRAWIGDCISAVHGVVLTGRAWWALRLLGLGAGVPLPRWRGSARQRRTR